MTMYFDDLSDQYIPTRGPVHSDYGPGTLRLGCILTVVRSDSGSWYVPLSKLIFWLAVPATALGII